MKRKTKKRRPKSLIEKFGLYYSHLPKNKRRIFLFEIEFFSMLGIVLLALSSILFFSYLESIDGLVAGDSSDSVTVSVTVVSAVSLNSPADVSLSPEIEEAGSTSGSVTWNVETNDPDGWKLEVNASASPALTSGGNSFADYDEAVSGTPEEWSVAAADSEFGFNSSGTYAEAGFSGDKYLGFNGANRIQAAHRNAPSEGTGDDTTINFKAESGSGHSQPLGTYTATITATATNL
ncbi:MAG: hypothetical protein WC831_05470 [Parcubacteria group bacterium]|jgi:hypothetical protein